MSARELTVDERPRLPFRAPGLGAGDDLVERAEVVESFLERAVPDPNPSDEREGDGKG